MRRPPTSRRRDVRRDDDAGQRQGRLGVSVASLRLSLARRRGDLAGVIKQASFLASPVTGPSIEDIALDSDLRTVALINRRWRPGRRHGEGRQHVRTQVGARAGHHHGRRAGPAPSRSAGVPAHGAAGRPRRAARPARADPLDEPGPAAGHAGQGGSAEPQDRRGAVRRGPGGRPLAGADRPAGQC